MSTEKVVFLKYRNENVADDRAEWFLSCKACGNKTYRLLCNDMQDYPTVECAGCHSVIGQMGWVHPDE